eukprot:gene15351-20686_t
MNISGNVIISVAMGQFLEVRNAVEFAGTARKIGITEDIIVVVSPDANTEFIQTLLKYDIIVFTSEVFCKSIHGTITNTIRVFTTDCSFINSTSVAISNQTEEISPENKMSPSEVSSINMLRYYVYQNLVVQYSSNSLVFLSDFKDVLFQSNPFNFKLDEWYPHNQLVMFLESHPNMIINRQPSNKGWILDCYGDKGLNLIGSNTVSCSGNTMGTRDAMIGYVVLMLKQLDPVVRYRMSGSKMPTKDTCTDLGKDQGFHNWLLYARILDKYMNVKVYQQGEGAVNVIGGFYGDKKLLKFHLNEWKVLQGVAPYQVICN